MSKLRTPFRYDFVGSFLRPERLKEARAARARGEISDQALEKVEEECIADLVRKQKELGYHGITDGEFRRSYWHLDFMWGLQGLEHIELDHGYFFHGEETTHGSCRVRGKISGEDHPFVRCFRFLKQFEDENTVARQTIPAPAQTLAELFRADNAEETARIYPDTEELIQDLAAAYRRVILDLYGAGCRNIQFDDCTWGMIVDDVYWKARVGNGSTQDEEASRYLRINNLSLRDLPEDLTVNTHICRGNYHSAYASSGPYDRVAPYVFASENVHAFYLEFDDERSGSFDCLSQIPEGKKVVLGLVTTKRPQLEDKEILKKRIHDASRFVPLERLCLSPQCGFASCEIGNKLTEEEQWNKLRLVKEVAEEVWGK